DSVQAPTVGFVRVLTVTGVQMCALLVYDLASVDVYYNGGTLLGSATVDSGNWSFTTAPLADGNYSFAVEVTDAAGNMTYTSAVPDRKSVVEGERGGAGATESGRGRSGKR